MARTKQVLPSTVRREVEKALETLQEFVGRLDQIEACGIDCQHFRERAFDYQEQLMKIMDHIFDNKPVEK